MVRDQYVFKHFHCKNYLGGLNMIKQIEAELFLKADLTVGYVNGA